MKPSGIRSFPGLALVVAAVTSATVFFGCTGGSAETSGNNNPSVRASMVYYAMPG